MARTFILSALLSLAGSLQAQTYFYINSISVDPAEPTASDAITISLAGDLSSSGALVVSAEYMLVSNTVHITVIAADPGGLSVLVPHTEQITIGNLPAGSYGILVDGNFMLDSAPEFQHGFNVSGGGQDPACDDLDIVSIGWHPFTDSLLVVHVTNTMENSAFGYPGFVLLDANGDTLASETVIYKGIGTDSWHTLVIHDNAIIPEEPFQGVLHLWTGFYEELACEWEPSIELCPSTECTALFPNLINLGNALGIGTYTWTITNDGAVMAQGQFELTAEVQSDQAETCLPPGAYQMTVSYDQEPTGGQLYFGINGENAIQGPSQALQFGTPTPLPFDLLEQCVDGTNSTDERQSSGPIVVTTIDGTILITDRTGTPLGTVVLYDAVGKEVARNRINSDRSQFLVTADGIYILRTSTVAMKVAVEHR